MNPFLKELLLLVPPPGNAKDTTGDWGAIEKDMGLIFPDDYKQFVGLYGTGTLCSLIEIDSPFRLSEVYQTSVRNAWIVRTGVYQQHDQFLEASPPYRFYPDFPGLLPCATYASGDIVGWLTNTDPELWHIGYRDRESGYFELFGIGFVEFLVGLVRGSLSAPEPYRSKMLVEGPKRFEPY